MGHGSRTVLVVREGVGTAQRLTRHQGRHPGRASARLGMHAHNIPVRTSTRRDHEEVDEGFVLPYSQPTTHPGKNETP